MINPYNYHLLRIALEQFGQPPQLLSQENYQLALSRAKKSYQIEAQVLTQPEAQQQQILPAQIDHAIKQLQQRYADADAFKTALSEHQLDETALREALERELRFNAVMQDIAALPVELSEMQLKAFYQQQSQRFNRPEQRHARHILITINSDYPENQPAAALARIEAIRKQLNVPTAQRQQRFCDLAQRYSECPSALEGGNLGELRRGQLYPQLDALLFNLKALQMGPVTRTELGYHLLLCESITPARTLPFSEVADKVRTLLSEKQRQQRQRQWLKEIAAI
ncbi:MAG: nitrogen fixation protein NifM [Gammaproteobacteria bacterium]|nr:nitrogen fixation protein NifM [Gammaproteobacteria bacterium]